MLSKRKPTHPGEILREDIIKPLNLTVTAAAQMLGVTRKTLSALLNCRAAMSPESTSATHLAAVQFNNNEILPGLYRFSIATTTRCVAHLHSSPESRLFLQGQ